MGQPRYQIPTRLQTEDTVLTVGSLTLTMRQSVIVLFGGSLAFACWHQMSGLPRHLGVLGLVFQLILATLPVLIALVIALTRLRGRSLEIWVLVLWRYWHLSKTLSASCQKENDHDHKHVFVLCSHRNHRERSALPAYRISSHVSGAHGSQWTQLPAQK
jgi:hypothetical protein